MNGSVRSNESFLCIFLKQFRRSTAFTQQQKDFELNSNNFSYRIYVVLSVSPFFLQFSVRSPLLHKICQVFYGTEQKVLCGGIIHTCRMDILDFSTSHCCALLCGVGNHGRHTTIISQEGMVMWGEQGRKGIHKIIFKDNIETKLIALATRVLLSIKEIQYRGYKSRSEG